MRRRRLSQARAPLSALTLVALVLASASTAGADATAPRASAKRATSFYSVATGLQYINSADDSARGKINNPFDPNENKLAPKNSGGGGGDGPTAGDIAIYSVNLFTDATLKTHAGSGVYTCYFNYDQHALCQAYYKTMTGGTVVASGPVDFNTSGFTIVITGGTSSYLGVRGQVVVGKSMKKSTQKVDFELVQ